MKKLRMRGQANDSGFEVTATIDTEINRFTTRNYDIKEGEVDSPANSWIISVILYILARIFYAELGLVLDIWANLFILLSAFSVGNMLWSVPTLLRKNSLWKQWHACEHKLVNAVTGDNSDLPRLEALKQISPYNSKCGSVVIIASLLANLYIICVLPFTGYLLPTILNFIGMVYLIIVLTRSFTCPKKYPFDRLTFPITIILAGFAALILLSQQQAQLLSVLMGSFAIELLTKYSGIPYLAQKYIFTAEPTQEQHEETFLLALKIQAWKKSIETEAEEL